MSASSLLPARARRTLVPLAVPALLLLTSAAPAGAARPTSSDTTGGGPDAPAAAPAVPAAPAPPVEADRTRVGRPALSPAGLAALVPPARVVGGHDLVEKPPPWRLPVASYHLTGRFGASSALWSSTHTGLDFAAPEGVPLVAVAPGRVVSAGPDGAFGNKTVLRLEDGTELWYCHQSAFVARPGQRVEAGDPVGRLGSTGNVTGPHLHLEVHPSGGRPVDPDAWLRAQGLTA